MIGPVKSCTQLAGLAGGLPIGLCWFWKICLRHQAGCETVSRRTSMTRSSRWRWNSPLCHLGNWRCGLTTKRATSCLTPLLTGFQGPRPDHQPGLCADQGGKRVRYQDELAQPRCSRPTSPTSGSSAGAGCSDPPCAPITRATSLPGSCAALCGLKTAAMRWTCCRPLQGAIKPMFSKTSPSERQRPLLYRHRT
jgi:hypothetical protein